MEERDRSISKRKDERKNRESKKKIRFRTHSSASGWICDHLAEQWFCRVAYPIGNRPLGWGTTGHYGHSLGVYDRYLRSGSKWSWMACENVKILPFIFGPYSPLFPPDIDQKVQVIDKGDDSSSGTLLLGRVGDIREPKFIWLAAVWSREYKQKRQGTFQRHGSVSYLRVKARLTFGAIKIFSTKHRYRWEEKYWCPWDNTLGLNDL